MPKRNANFKHDLKKHGPTVAHYNDGFLKGWDNGFKKGFARACELILSAMEGKPQRWSAAERRLCPRGKR